MEACFINLFTVSFLHEYFPTTGFTGLQVKPDNATANTILKNGLLFKQFKNSFTILYDKYFFGKDATLQDVLKNELTLTFLLKLDDPYFYNYTTDFGADINQLNFSFSNLPGMSCQKDKGTYLHRDDYASVKDLTLRSGEDTGLFGKITIAINKNLQQDYYIRFDQKETYLRYFLVSDHLQTLDKPAIIDSSNQQKFSEPSPVSMMNDKKAIAFTSEKAIRFNSNAKSNFNLVENYESNTGKFKLVRSSLPLPDIRAVSKTLSEDTKANKNFSDIFL